jgi:hypothetical protein
MILSNRFNKTDMQRIWQDLSACAICYSNQNLSIHHLYGCKGKHNNSPVNSVLLCYPHHKEFDCINTHTTGDERKIEVLGIILKQIAKSNYKFVQNDYDFIESIKPDFIEASDRLI